VGHVPALYEPAMRILDHFGGLWFITHYGMAAVPSSWPWAAVCIVAGALCGARPRGSASGPATVMQ
jgi:hypothetical protein